MKRSTSFGVHVGAIMLALTATLALPLQSIASGGGDGCNPGRTSVSEVSFVGWTQTNGGARIGGASGNFLNYSPWVATGTTVSAWTRISTGSEWGEVGWLENAGGVRHDFYEYNDITYGYWLQTLVAQPINNTTNYNVMYENHAAHTLTLRITGTYRDLLCQNPSSDGYCDFYQAVDWVPDSSAQYGEIQNDADQVPGHYNVPEYVKSAQIWFSSWVDYNGTLGRSHTWMNYAKIASNWLQISDASTACHF